MFSLTDLSTGHEQVEYEVQDLSDGTNTFRELHNYKDSLFIALMLMAHNAGKKAWWSYNHHDGTPYSKYSNVCIACIEVEENKQILYYLNFNGFESNLAFLSLEVPNALRPDKGLGYSDESTLEAIYSLIASMNESFKN